MQNKDQTPQPAQPEVGGMYSEREREIFWYEMPPGSGKRCVDPLVIRRALLRLSGGQWRTWRNGAVEPEFEKLPEGLDPQQVAMERARRDAERFASLDAQERCEQVVIEVFGLTPLDVATGKGCTTADVWEVIGAFEEWLEKNGKSTGS